MRVVYSTRPFLGHLHPFVPLGRDLLARGHDVAVASGPEVIPAVVEAGLTWLPAGLHPREAQERFPDDDPDYGVATLRTKVNELLEVLLTWYRPQLVIREPTDLAAAIATEISGTPCVSLGISHFIPARSWLYLAEEPLRTLRRDYGLPPDPELTFLFRGLYLDTVPPSWEDFEGAPPADVLRMGYRIWDGEADPHPSWSEPGAAKPAVLVTLGTVFNDQPELLEMFLTALDDLAVSVICTTGDDALPPPVTSQNVRVETYVPHSTILPHCRVLLCHGGFNTVMGALCHGVPVVCVPLGADQYYNAQRCEELGAGIGLDREGLSAATIRDAVATVLDEPRFAAAALKIRSEIEGLPGPGEVSGVLEELASGRRFARGSP